MQHDATCMYSRWPMRLPSASHDSVLCTNQASREIAYKENNASSSSGTAEQGLCTEACAALVLSKPEEKRTGCLRMLKNALIIKSTYSRIVIFLRMRTIAASTSWSQLQRTLLKVTGCSNLQKLSDMYESDWIGSILPMGSLSRERNYFWTL